MPSPSLSIALCTYNGSAHLSEQLDSITKQTVLPDELIIFDDHSTDATLDILKNFAASTKIFPITIHSNPQTVGPTRNFSNAIAACTGDIIALCDQDDIWHQHKLALIAAAFQNRPDVGFVFGDAVVCDESGHSLGYRLWNSVRFSPRLQRQVKHGCAFEVLLRQNIVTGAAMAFASRFRSTILPIDSNWVHDGWIALLLSALAPVVAIDKPIIQYRQHPNQAIGAIQRSLYQEYKNAKAMDRNIFQQQAEMFEAALKRLSEVNAPVRTLQLLQQKIRHCQTRSSVRKRESSRLLAFNEFLSLRYRHFSLGWKSFAQDLFL